MKLIVQIPCLNEAETLPRTLAELPRHIAGFDEVEWLVIDDGSTDSTVEIARAHRVDHIVRLTNNKGLAAAFQAGIDACLKLGADVIVNTDADNQYRAADIGRLVAPILAGDADMVVGDRGVRGLDHFSRSKRGLQRLGSWVVRRASGTNVPDTTSGFRAYNREAALQLQVVSNFTYTLESLIQAGKMLVAIDHVPVATNRTERRSRLFPSTWNYVRRNAVEIFRAYAMYEPLRVFTTAAVVLAIAALVAWTPFLADWIVNGDSSGHIQSLILGAVLAIAAVQMFALGVVGDALAGQRVMAQRTFERIRRIELRLGVEPSHYERVEGGDAEARATGTELHPAGDPAAPGGGPETRPAADPAAGGREAEQAAGSDSVAAPAARPE
jgi:glycosyltransferase involved in cell wall biosynthesis